ncbi:MAG: RNA ligase partner protein [Euryarchaeota archaeon]|nr:RNA ligase partner protein [Euryarchaeota archaeon]
MQLKQRFVLDTTALTAQELRGEDDLCTTVKRIMSLIADARTKLNISCHIPYPTVYNELCDFIRRHGCDDDVITEIDTWLVKKTPDRYEVKIPSEVFYEYVKDIRERMNRGMKVSEALIWVASDESANIVKKGGDKAQVKEATGNTIKELRAKYRNALRYGTLDSAPDLDVLLLAKEMDAGVIASDEGIKKWAEKLGLRYVEGTSFPKMLEEYLLHMG